MAGQSAHLAFATTAKLRPCSPASGGFIAAFSQQVGLERQPSMVLTICRCGGAAGGRPWRLPLRAHHLPATASAASCVSVRLPVVGSSSVLGAVLHFSCTVHRCCRLFQATVCFRRLPDLLIIGDVAHLFVYRRRLSDVFNPGLFGARISMPSSSTVHVVWLSPTAGGYCRGRVRSGLICCWSSQVCVYRLIRRIPWLLSGLVLRPIAISRWRVRLWRRLTIPLAPQPLCIAP